MINVSIDVIVIGAGHAGLCISYYLTKNGIKHIVLEQERIGETWHSQRWDSFKLNSANKLNLLPEQPAYFKDPEAFAFANEFAISLEHYSKQWKLPVKEFCKVVEVKRDEIQHIFLVTVLEDNMERVYLSKQLVIASGGQNTIHIPDFANLISKNILQLHTSQYKNTNQLPNGNVLVVGSAQSGIQIAEDLVRAAKKVFLSTGKVGRIPRRYRGRDIYDWLFEIGFYDTYTDDIADLSLFKIKNPQVSGWGERGKTCSLQSLSKDGVVILGTVENADEDYINLQSNAASHVRYADEFSLKVKILIDDYIKKNKVTASLPEIDPDDVPDEHVTCASNITILDLKENNITSIIWSTGFSADFSYLKLDVLNEIKMPKHHNGISEIKGLYFIGLPWLRKRKSAVIPGISDDAEFIVKNIIENIFP